MSKKSDGLSNASETIIALLIAGAVVAGLAYFILWVDHPQRPTTTLTRAGECHEAVRASNTAPRIFAQAKLGLSDGELADVQSEVSSALTAVTTTFGTLTTPLDVVVVETVERPEYVAARGVPWTGHWFRDQDRLVIHIGKRWMRSQEELRFYLTFARLNDLGPALESNVLKLGLAAWMRSENGRDSVAIELSKGSLTAVNNGFSLEQLKRDPLFRSQARASSWNVVYYLLEVKKLPIASVLKLRDAELPNPTEIVNEVRAKTR